MSWEARKLSWGTWETELKSYAENLSWKATKPLKQHSFLWGSKEISSEYFIDKSHSDSISHHLSKFVLFSLTLENTQGPRLARIDRCIVFPTQWMCHLPTLEKISTFLRGGETARSGFFEPLINVYCGLFLCEWLLLELMETVWRSQ